MRRALHLLRTLWEDLTGAARLAADARSFLRLTTDFLLYRPMKLFRPPGFNRERQIRVRGGVTITYRLNRGDIWAIHEVWIREIYRMPLGQKPSVIVDLGANIGMTALWLATQYGCSRLIAVEPVQANADLTRRNLEQNGVCAEVLVAAVGAVDGTATLQETVSSTNSTVTFERQNHGEHRETRGKDDLTTESAERHGEREETLHLIIPYTESSIPEHLNTRTPENAELHTHPSSLIPHPSIPVVSMLSVLKSLPGEARVDILKMDIEGSEGEVLSGEVDWLARVEALIAEFHPAHADPVILTATLEQAGLKVTLRDFSEENIAFFTRAA